ncbi:hypothetical protein [Candidatus Enterovibrio escicola]|uniref:Uncharacterized protein n=1 Tax=Candidatus Enterovibrio escicola TaxID=1927127 RepID=A0A2A5T216_9GAMM|nr:hypothetical protein [Candidatus Enterovibrio escacola]PCS22213.1 hypothetical protein BTN49_2167 [Candidatus Enterovibrio escacola]
MTIAERSKLFALKKQAYYHELSVGNKGKYIPNFSHSGTGNLNLRDHKDNQVPSFLS